MTRPRLIVTDLDGTLLSRPNSLSELAVEAIAFAADAGVPVLFATGRPVRWLDVLSGVRTSLPLALISNGAALYDLSAERIRWSMPVDPAFALEVAREVRLEVPAVAFGVEFADGFGHESSYEIDSHHDQHSRIAPLEELVEQGEFMKLLVQQLAWRPEPLATTVRHIAGDRLNVTFSSTVGMLEVSAPGVSKGTALARLAAELGIEAADVVAFGDMPNDLEMLSWAGRGYAMANAHPHLLDAGLRQVGFHHEDAVAHKIRELVSLEPGPGWLPLHSAPAGLS